MTNHGGILAQVLGVDLSSVIAIYPVFFFQPSNKINLEAVQPFAKRGKTYELRMSSSPKDIQNGDFGRKVRFKKQVSPELSLQ